MPLERLAQEAFGGSQIASLAEPEFDRVAIAVDGAVEVHPSAADPDICLVHVPFPADRALASIELLQQQRGVVNRPAMDGGMVHRHASFGHHLFQIAQAQAIGQIPPHAQQDD